MAHNLFDSLQTFTTAAEKTGQFYALPQLEKAGVGPIFSASSQYPYRAGVGFAQL